MDKLRKTGQEKFLACSACQKSPGRTFLTASTAERFEKFKTLLRPKSLKNQAFLRRVIVTRGGS
ncbi:MAG: hypothetical protein ACI3VA_09360 [Candidatus Limivicinus sp.]